MLKLFGVPHAIHESVVAEALQSQRIIIADLLAKTVVLEKENLTLRNALDDRARDLDELKRSTAAILEARPAPAAPGQGTNPIAPKWPPVAVRPSFGQANSHHGFSRPKPTTETPAPESLLG